MRALDEWDSTAFFSLRVFSTPEQNPRPLKHQ